MINKVFVIQEGNNDYSPAEEFGEVHFITTGDLRNIEGSKQNSQVMTDLWRFKASYITGKDYIVPVGNPVLIALVAMILGPGSHKFLKWDGRRAAYIPFTLNREMIK